MAIMLRPGQEFKEFQILKKKTTRSSAGSIGKSAGFEEIGTLKGAISSTSPRETEFWKQNGHEVSHKIIQYHGAKAKKGQFLQRVNPVTNEVNTYYIETIKNPGGLDHFTVYMVNERDDLKHEQSVSTDRSGQNQN